jgi:hypothetical protein
MLSAQLVGTAFTVQGEFKESTLPAPGNYDLRFVLMSAASGGIQLGTTQCVDNLTVADGRFAAVVDFGAEFVGQKRWIEVQVRADPTQDPGLNCANATGYETLSPRLEVTPSPHSAFAQSASTANSAATATTALAAGTAATANNALSIGGTPASNVATLLGNHTFTGVVNFSNAGNALTGTFTGNGAAMTILNGAGVQAGTLTRSRVAADIETVLSQWNQAPGQTVQQPLDAVGWGNDLNSQITIPSLPPGLAALNASNLSSGTVADARLSTNIPRLNAVSSAFTGNVSVTGTVQATGGFVFPDSTTQTTAVSPIISAAVSVDPPSLASVAGTTVTITIAGAAVGDAVVANPGANLTAGYVLSFARASAADTVTLGFYNATAATIIPSASTWQFRVMK